MGESVEERHDGGRTLEDLVPLRKRLVGGDDRGDALVSAGDDHEEQVSGARVVAEIPHLVDAKQLRTRVVTKSVLKGVRRLALGQIGKQSARGGKQSRNAVQNRLVTEILRQHGLADAIGTEEDQILCLRDEVETEGLLQRISVDALGPRPVEVREGSEAAQVCSGNATLQAERNPR